MSSQRHLQRSARKPRRNLLFVSAGLELDGGGRALAGRLFARATADWAAEEDIDWQLVSLRGLADFAADSRASAFDDRQKALGWHVVRRQLMDRHTACVFDLLGPARVQMMLPRFVRAPYLVPLYGIEVWQRLQGLRRKALTEATIRLAVSNYTRQRALAAQESDSPLDIAVVPLCLEDRAPTGVVNADLLKRAGSDFILMVGRMAATERYKGHDEVLQVLAAASRRREVTGPRLVIAGDGTDRPRLETLADSLGLGDQVLFTGFVSEASLAELYRRGSVLVLPSLGEGFGLVYLEAMRAGRPCIAARGGAGAEIVVDGETGILVDPTNQGELGAAIDRVLQKPEWAAQLGEAGQRRYRVHYSHSQFLSRIRPLFSRLIA